MQSNLSQLTARIMPSEKAPVAFKLNTARSLNRNHVLLNINKIA